MITTHLHLYESIGQLCYKPIWSRRVLEHISRMALPQNTCTVFHLKANSYKDLWIHAWLGVSFIYPQVILENFSDCVFEDLEGVEEKLNSILKDLIIESHIILDKAAVVKRLLGDRFFSKIFENQQVESRVRCLLLNRMKTMQA